MASMREGGIHINPPQLGVYGLRRELLASNKSYRCLCKKHSSGEEDSSEDQLESIKSGAGEQFLPLVCMAKVRPKGVLFHRNRY